MTSQTHRHKKSARVFSGHESDCTQEPYNITTVATAPITSTHYFPPQPAIERGLSDNQCWS